VNSKEMLVIRNIVQPMSVLDSIDGKETPF